MGEESTTAKGQKDEETTTKRCPLSDDDDGNKESKRLKLDEDVSKTTTTSSTGSNNNAAATLPVIDVAERLPSGTRLAVHWDISNPTSDIEPPHEATTTTTTLSSSHWWKATLLPFDGRVTNDDDNLAIRVLEYDALPEYGYPETSREDVIFVSSSLLVNYRVSEEEEEEHEELEYKVLSKNDEEEEESNFSIVCCSDADIEDLVNTTLANALEKAFLNNKFQELPAALQATLADTIATKKEKLVNLLRLHMRTHSIVSGNDMKLLLAQTMSDHDDV